MVIVMRRFHCHLGRHRGRRRIDSHRKIETLLYSVVNGDAMESFRGQSVGEMELVLSTMKEEIVVYIHLLQTLICRFCLSADLAINGHIIPDVLMNI
jgi:hypothetical protein